MGPALARPARLPPRSRRIRVMPGPAAGRHHEVLVHNIGHHDLALLLAVPGVETAYPRGFAVARLADAVARAPIQWAKVESRGPNAGVLGINPPTDLGLGGELARKLDLGERRRDIVERYPAPPIVGAQLRLLASVLERWVDDGPGEASRRLVLLCTAPLDPSQAPGSTDGVAALIRRYVAATFPEIDVPELPPFRVDPFRFDKMEAFVEDHVVPAVDRSAKESAAEHGDHWRDRFRVTLSLSTGTFAMVAAATAGLRRFRPAMLHIPSARAPFQRGEALRVESFPWNVVDQRVARPVGEVAAPVRAVAEEMARWHRVFVRAADDRAGEIERFWLRKTKKPVLAVLAVEGQDGRLQFHRGVNLEVSMPTGSLCAERNAIGSALAANPLLRRDQLRYVAVLSVTRDGEGVGNPLSPCGACSEWLAKIVEANPGFRVITFADEQCERVHVGPVAWSW